MHPQRRCAAKRTNNVPPRPSPDCMPDRPHCWSAFQLPSIPGPSAYGTHNNALIQTVTLPSPFPKWVFGRQATKNRIILNILKTNPLPATRLQSILDTVSNICSGSLNEILLEKRTLSVEKIFENWPRRFVNVIEVNAPLYLFQ